jgi:hypothetical protein
MEKSNGVMTLQKIEDNENAMKKLGKKEDDVIRCI